MNEPRNAAVCAALILITSTAAAAPAPKPALTAEEAVNLTREISGAVETIRGLRFKRPVAVKLVDDAEARRHFQKRLEKFWPPEQMVLEQKAQVQLGLLPAGTDVMGSLLDLLEEQAGGYYDPDSDTFFILTDMPRGIAPILFAHELTHALDDQHFDLDKALAEAMVDDDRGSAVGAVIEGSGMLVMSAYLVREMQAGRLTPTAMLELQQSEAGKAKKLGSAPPLMQRLLLAPYLLGHAFLLRGDPAALAKGVPAEDINRAFEAPPESTEQLLHPDKYWVAAQHDAPRVLTLPDQSERLGKDWKLGVSGSLGELTLAVLTGAGSLDPRSPDAARPERWTSRGASGWGGDRYQLYVGPGGKTATALVTAWDSPAEAAEFEASLTAAAPKVRVRRGDVVVLVAAAAGVDAEALAAASADAVTAGTKRSAR